MTILEQTRKNNTKAMSKRFTILFWLTVGLQIIIVVAVFGFSYLEGALGQNVLLKLAAPRDPLSLFQGHYLILNYEISTLEMKNLAPSKEVFDYRDEIFVGLEEKNGYWQAVSLSETKPRGGVFIKGKVVYPAFTPGGAITAWYGIEKYFIPEKDWQETESALRQAVSSGDVFIEVSISPFSHKGSVKKIFINNEEFKLGKSLSSQSNQPSGTSYTPQAKARDARIIAALAQSRSIMVIAQVNDGSYDNFNCQYPDQAQLCLDVSNVDSKVFIAKYPVKNSQQACAFAAMNNPQTPWYCVDSYGRAGFSAVHPGASGYCLEGRSAVCPRLLGEEGDNIPALEPLPQVFETNAAPTTTPAATSERSIKVISPNGGETFCLGEDINIKWQSEGVKAAGIRTNQDFSPRSGFSNILAPSVLADSDDSGIPGRGLFPWKVGTIFYHEGVRMEEGFNYKIEIFSVDGKTEVSDESDEFFTIIKCEG